MASFEDLFDDLWRTPRGKVCICNLLDCDTMRLVDRDLLKEFANHWLSEYYSYFAPGDPLAMFDIVTTKKDTGTYKYLWKGLHAPTLRSGYITTVINSKYLEGQLDRESKKKFDSVFRLISRFHASNTMRDLEHLEREIFELIKNVSTKENRNGFIEVTFDKPIGGPKPMVWFTGYDEGEIEDHIWQAEPDWSQRADIARDKLGLIHMGSSAKVLGTFEPMLLVMIVVAADTIPAGIKLARPTFMDAGTHSRFRGAFGNLSKRANNWGRAVDLSRILFPRPHRGGREIALQNFQPDGPVKISVLGFTRVPRKDYLNVHDKDFARSMLRSRERAKLMERFVRVCQ